MSNQNNSKALEAVREMIKQFQGYLEDAHANSELNYDWQSGYFAGLSTAYSDVITEFERLEIYLKDLLIREQREKEMRQYLEENNATGLDYRLMLEYLVGDLELNQMGSLLKWQGENLRNQSQEDKSG